MTCLQSLFSHIAHWFPSLFDWGSFWGGVLGVVGAFGAALLSFNLQRIPAKRRMCVELKIKMHRQFAQSRVELGKCTNTNLGTVVGYSAIAHEAFQELLPLASECDKKVFKMLVSLLDDMDKVLKTITLEEYTDRGYMGGYASLTRGNDVSRQLVELLEDYRKTI